MRKHRLLACMMAVIMAVGLIPSTALAAGTKTANPKPDPISYPNGVSLGKTVTNQSAWNSSKEAQVTLTVAPPSPKEPVAVEFVLDATESLLLSKDNAHTLISTYATQIMNAFSGKNVYFGITVFANKAQTVLPMTKDTNTITNKMIYDVEASTIALSTNPENVGTNVQDGIRKGIDALNEGISTLATSGITVAPNNRFLVLITDGGSFFYYDYNDPTKLIGEYNEAADTPSRVSTSLDDLRDSSGGFNSDADTHFEQAIVASADAADSIPADINLITFGFPYYNEIGALKNLTDLAGDFVSYVATKSNCKYSNFLSTISDLSVVVPSGSVITDVIGYNADKSKGEVYNFDVVTDKEFVLNFNGVKISGTLTGNSIVFAFKGEEYGTLTYYPADDGSENFTLTLNQDLLIGQTLTLSYYVKLKDPDLSSGTHLVDTNVEAKLTVPDNSSSSMLFPKPSLSYTVSGGGGGYTPPPLLNTEDHFGYIIGYPVDYYTGEKTDDQTKMPVKPQGQITRAEVATIFFRMLTDNARNEYWSQTSSYTDVEADDWFNNAICTLSNAGIISGYPDGSFQPNGKITRAEFATIASRFFDVEASGSDIFPDIDGHWAEQYINEAATAGIINGYEDGTFRPQKLITRAEAVTMVNRTLGRAPDQDHFLPDMLVWPDNMDTSKWYYAQMQEATNSHEYEMKTKSDGTKYEVWTKMLPIRDWQAFEKEWSDSNSSENPGEVV